MSFYYNINTDTFISPEVMRRTRRIANYTGVYLTEDLPYRQIYLERYCHETGEEVRIEEPVYGLIFVQTEGKKYTETENKEFIRQYIKEHGYVWDSRKIINGVPDESTHYESLYHKYETNNWLKAHHMPMRRTVPKRYLKNSSSVTHLHTLELLPCIIGPSGTGKTIKLISPNILSNIQKTDEEE